MTDRNPACFTPNPAAPGAVEQLPHSDQWRSTCNCRDDNGQQTVTCESGTEDEARRALLEHRGEPTEEPA